MLHHVFGATSVAMSTVLTMFMAGLGLGTWLGGKYADRIRHPIITYAIVELGVGAWGLVLPMLVRSDGWLADVNAFLAAELGRDSGWMMIARFVCVAPLLILPTTLMGSSFPLLTRHFVSVGEDARSAAARVGALYAINTLGAATGPILSAFVLLPSWGLSWANATACSMNFALAALIFLARKPLLRGSWTPGEKLRFWPEKHVIELAPAQAGGASGSDEPQRDGNHADAASEEPTRRKSKAADKKRTSRSAPATPPPREPVIPELARKMAFVCFAVSGGAALCYEVVWSRALAMTIGSSIYSFALILVTYLIGIAAGSAAMSSFMGDRARPFVGLAATSIALVVLANVPWAIDIVDPSNTAQRFTGSWANFALLSALFAGPVVLAALWAHLKGGRPDDDTAAFREVVDWRPLVVVLMASMPVIAAAVNTIRFPGFLPKIALSVVAAVAVFLVLGSILSRAPTLLLAIFQLFIAGATLVSYVWQDEIPRAFAQLVASIPRGELPDHIGTVKVFMFLTVVLCQIPATLGMGAMFPLTVRIWTSGGAKIASDVASVYAGNTVGSIIGSWLPGFILFALIGAERTLHLGVAINMTLALLMLIAGVADPEEEKGFWSWRRFATVALPVVAAALLASSALPVRADDIHWWVRASGAAAFLAVAIAAYALLRSRHAGRAWPAAIAWSAVLVPLVLGSAIAVFAVDPRPTDPWALRAAYGALRIFVGGVGFYVAWASWREDHDAGAHVSESTRSAA